VSEQPPGYAPRPGPGQGVGTNGMAVASLVCSLFGWLCLIGPILGLIFGFLALGQIKQSGQGGRGMAIAGIVIGAVAIAVITGLGILRLVVGTESHHGSGAPAVVITVEWQPLLAAVA
jgi:hypothetical protein